MSGSTCEALAQAREEAFGGVDHRSLMRLQGLAGPFVDMVRQRIDHFGAVIGKRLDDGTLSPFSVKIGNEVLFTSYGGTEVKIDGEELMIMSEDDILAVVE